MKVTLPNVIATSLSTIRWPLGPSSSPPLYFEPLNIMQEIRENSSSLNNLECASNLPKTIDELFSKEDGDSESRFFGLISLSLILLGHGYTDEAHDIVTPLSWPEETHFGNGPSVYAKIQPSPRSFATYVHCLVHRREAFNVGEFGMVGFANANYWSNAVLQSPGVGSLPHDEIRREILDVVNCYKKDVSEVRDWLDKHPCLSPDGGYWESRAVHELCANVLRNTNKDSKLQKFAELVAETELRVLLGSALQKAGYSVDPKTVHHRYNTNNSRPVASIDVNLASSVANKISSAHLQSFKMNSVVTMRNVIRTDEITNSDSNMLASSAAAGVATRLLGTRACVYLTQDDSLQQYENLIRIALPITLNEADSVNSLFTNNSNGGPLSTGDVSAFLVKAKNWRIADNDVEATYHFASCDVNDSSAFFVDHLYDSRGETPTTVIQWSKG